MYSLQDFNKYQYQDRMNRKKVLTVVLDSVIT